MDHAVAVALVIGAVRVRGLGMPPPAADFDARGVRGKHEDSF
jgi:hypothetical protein